MHSDFSTSLTMMTTGGCDIFLLPMRLIRKFCDFCHNCCLSMHCRIIRCIICIWAFNWHRKFNDSIYVCLDLLLLLFLLSNIWKMLPVLPEERCVSRWMMFHCLRTCMVCCVLSRSQTVAFYT